MEEQEQKSQREFRHIIRIANTDLDGNKQVCCALTKIKGIGVIYSNMICNLTDIEKNLKVGKLNNEQIAKIKDIIENPDKYKVPEWMMNRRKDFYDANNKHILDAELRFTNENDIKRLKKIRSYRGFRHAYGLPVRGQRTKSNFRKNKGKAIGVKKRKGAKAGRV
ncbi:30S ribosomal protein S13 [Candidatus Woesearchaeota archaeon]|nr:30S ribosomal protein S13 [Candidatus Woesearchaeota archaeon]